MESKIAVDTVIGRAAGLVATDMNGEKVMMDIEQGQYYALDSIGSRIWDLMENKQSVEAIVSVLLEEYDVEQQQCEQDVLILLNELYAEGLITID